jgi:hypothetical protein
MTPTEALGYLLGLACGCVRRWSRPVNFGVGLTLLLSGIVLFWVIHRMDPGDNTPAAVLIGGSIFCPGAIFLARTFWPQTGDKK